MSQLGTYTQHMSIGAVEASLGVLAGSAAAGTVAAVTGTGGSVVTNMTT